MLFFPGLDQPCSFHLFLSVYVCLLLLVFLSIVRSNSVTGIIAGLDQASSVYLFFFPAGIVITIFVNASRMVSQALLPAWMKRDK